jgi:hypothetical protein|nr:MAG TPA: hypothetical protein [Caudoviricetes sp.]
MGNEKWGNYTQEFEFTPDAEEIKNVQELLDRPYSCTDFSPAARCAVQILLKYAREEHVQHLKFESNFLELNKNCAIYEEILARKDRMIDDLRQQLSFMQQARWDAGV